MEHELAPGSHEGTKHERAIVFDGVCQWCNFGDNFAIDRDARGQFTLGTLRSKHAGEIRQELQLAPNDFEIFLLLERSRVFTKSTAALRVAKQFSDLWPLLYLFVVVPRPLRDAITMLWRTTGTSGWERPRPAAFPLRTTEPDLCNHDERTQILPAPRRNANV
ncbi:thiol-disulfide oxidoreductase DCC family protein [Nitrospira lenta]|uniref:DUF393 domain-containing protein n=1 Tax=Nitrospira lenta TaxID=1436998 RepID=A0A330L4M5_9BACT|nr:hypothetical protein NITLEN_100027 [Nitrospira lenta]